MLKSRIQNLKWFSSHGRLCENFTMIQKSHSKTIKMLQLDVNLEVKVIGSRKLAYW